MALARVLDVLASHLAGAADVDDGHRAATFGRACKRPPTDSRRSNSTTEPSAPAHPSSCHRDPFRERESSTSSSVVATTAGAGIIAATWPTRPPRAAGCDHLTT